MCATLIMSSIVHEPVRAKRSLSVDMCRKAVRLRHNRYCVEDWSKWPLSQYSCRRRRRRCCCHLEESPCYGQHPFECSSTDPRGLIANFFLFTTDQVLSVNRLLNLVIGTTHNSDDDVLFLVRNYVYTLLGSRFGFVDESICLARLALEHLTVNIPGAQLNTKIAPSSLLQINDRFIKYVHETNRDEFGRYSSNCSEILQIIFVSRNTSNM